MSSSKNDFQIAHSSGAGVRKRGYVRKECWDHIKDFVIAEKDKGRRRKAILKALEDQYGIQMKVQKLQWLMDKWNIAHKNLNDGNKKYIFETERRLKRKGSTAVRRWYHMKESTRVRIKQTQLDPFMEGDGQAFKNEVAISKNIIFSPFEALGNTPQESSCHVSPISERNDPRLIMPQSETRPEDTMEIEEDADGEPSMIIRDACHSEDTFTMTEPVFLEYVVTPTRDCAADVSIFLPNQVVATPGQRAETIFAYSIQPAEEARAPAEHQDDDSDMEEDEVEALEISDAETDGSDFDDEMAEGSVDFGSENDRSSIGDEMTEELTDSDCENEELFFEDDRVKRPSNGCTALGVPVSLLKNLGFSLEQSIGVIPEENKEDTLNDLRNLLTPESFSYYLSQTYKKELDEYVAETVEFYRCYVQKVEALLSEGSLNLNECEDAAHAETMARTGSNLFQISYKRASFIVGDEEEWERHLVVDGMDLDPDGKIEEAVKNLFCKYFFDIFDEEQRGQHISTGWLGFTKFHIPLLISEYGFYHWTTLDAMFELGYVTDDLMVVDWLLSIYESFGFSEETARLLDLKTQMLQRGGMMDAARATVERAYLRCSKRWGQHSLLALRWLAKRLELSRGNDSDASKIINEISNSAKSMPARKITTSNDGATVGFLLARIRSLSSAPSAQVLEIAKTLDSQVQYKSESLDIYWYANEYIHYEFQRARIYYDSKDFTRSLATLQRAIQRPNNLHEYDWADDVIDLCVEVMTVRGLVRHTEPILERLVRVCKDKKVPEDDPTYKSIFFAAGSAMFQRYIDEEEKWSVSRFVMPYVES